MSRQRSSSQGDIIDTPSTPEACFENLVKTVSVYVYLEIFDDAYQAILHLSIESFFLVLLFLRWTFKLQKSLVCLVNQCFWSVAKEIYA